MGLTDKIRGAGRAAIAATALLAGCASINQSAHYAPASVINPESVERTDIRHVTKNEREPVEIILSNGYLPMAGQDTVYICLRQPGRALYDSDEAITASVEINRFRDLNPAAVEIDVINVDTGRITARGIYDEREAAAKMARGELARTEIHISNVDSYTGKFGRYGVVVREGKGKICQEEDFRVGD